MIDEMGAGMYKGKSIFGKRKLQRQKHKSNALVIPDERRGAIPPCRPNYNEAKKRIIKNESIKQIVELLGQGYATLEILRVIRIE